MARGNIGDYYAAMSPEEREAAYKRNGERLRSPEVQAKRKAAVEKKKCLRDLTRYMLEADLPEEDDIREELEDRGFEASEQGAITIALIRKARTGDVEAARYLRDTSGQKPVDGYSIDVLAGDAKTMDLSQYSDAELLAMLEHETTDQ